MKFEVSGPAHESEIIHNKKSKQRCQELGLTRLETTTQVVGAGKETDRQTDRLAASAYGQGEKQRPWP